MSIEYRILESLKKQGVLTLRIEDGQFAFNHTLYHEKDEYEEFGLTDFGFEIVKDRKIYHVNGQIITYPEFRFVSSVIDDF